MLMLNVLTKDSLGSRQGRRIACLAPSISTFAFPVDSGYEAISRIILSAIERFTMVIGHIYVVFRDRRQRLVFAA